MPATSSPLPPASRLLLPDAPADLEGPVKAWNEPVRMATYLPEPPNQNPMFLEKRVYQGSSGRVYPLPFIDRIADRPVEHEWQAVHIENEYIRITLLPEIGGRIHVGFDKISGHDFFYRQNVIKPALVGLAGPWISGGVEFNWPQHHRPATFMPVETSIEHGPEGEITVWCSDHDPMLRMKGMHGVCLRPGQAAVELKVRLYNRTPYTQTFLWWANVATRVHERYQSFFPTDVRFVADHARRAITTFPLSEHPYYGVDYPGRAQHGVPEDERPNNFQPDGSYAANDLSWYANIPVPTSYMVTGTAQDFFGGYDHAAGAGVVHVANHHIAPGKKQWTWGNHEFGYAWDRSLTDEDGPYIELMAGVYTDNQPDFSFLSPWETKTFTQTWFPIRDTGTPRMATQEAALGLAKQEGSLEVRLCVTRDLPGAELQVWADGREQTRWTTDLSPRQTFLCSWPTERPLEDFAVRLVVAGKTLLEYDPAVQAPAAEPEVAAEPAAPEQITSVDELYLTGVHLEQYRHATRRPELYWLEALARDPADSRCLLAMGQWHLRRGEFPEAAEHFRACLRRTTRLNANPADGEPHYLLGITLRLLGETAQAYDALYKATWNAAWRSPAFFALAEIDVSRRDWARAEEHLRRALRAEADHLHARNLLTYVLGRQGRQAEADRTLAETIALDPLDIGARWLQGQAPSDGQMVLDLAFDLIRCGRNEEVITLLESTTSARDERSGPMLLLTLLDLQRNDGSPEAERTRALLQRTAPGLCFPSRLEEMLVLQRTLVAEPEHAVASYLLGNLLYDRRRYQEAITAWEASARAGAKFATVWRNLGIAYFNVRSDPAEALAAYDRAFALGPDDSRVLYERDQLWKRVGRTPQERAAELLRHIELVQSRDSLAVELATLFNQLGEPERALELLCGRRFQPWEGGEGLVLAQYVRAWLLFGRRQLTAQQPGAALASFQAALHPPESLSEARHLLANQSEIWFLLGRAHEELAQPGEAVRCFERAVRQRGDFQQMSVRAVSDMTFWSSLALEALGREDEARSLYRQIDMYAETLRQTAPQIDYFATSLPAMLLFEDDLVGRNAQEADLLSAQAAIGFGEVHIAETLLRSILQRDPSHAVAQDLLLLPESLRHFMVTL